MTPAWPIFDVTAPGSRGTHSCDPHKWREGNLAPATALCVPTPTPQSCGLPPLINTPPLHSREQGKGSLKGLQGKGIACWLRGRKSLISFSLLLPSTNLLGIGQTSSLLQAAAPRHPAERLTNHIFAKDIVQKLVQRNELHAVGFFPITMTE